MAAMQKVVKKGLILSVSAVLLSGCANTPRAPVTSDDPLEGLNRKVFSFNRTLDNWVVKPITKAYRFAVPEPFRFMIGNAYSNINEFPTVANDLLQGKFSQAVNDTSRFVLNSTLGIFGAIDFATAAGLEKHDEDLGQTLAHWGWRDSVYIVWPFFGPSTFRDTVGWAGDHYAFYLPHYLDDDGTETSIWIGGMLNRRSELLDHEEAFQAAAVDEYATVRAAYLQRRNYLITGRDEGIHEGGTMDDLVMPE